MMMMMTDGRRRVTEKREACVWDAFWKYESWKSEKIVRVLAGIGAALRGTFTKAPFEKKH